MLNNKNKNKKIQRCRSESSYSSRLKNWGNNKYVLRIGHKLKIWTKLKKKKKLTLKKPYKIQKFDKIDIGQNQKLDKVKIA